jgi:hypothetical protein
MNKKRLEMGEEKWEEHQRQRKINKAKNWRSKNVQKVVDWRRRTKEALIAYKGGKCQECGYEKDCPSAYDFHHRDPSTKSFGIGAKGITRKLEELKKEADKCDLLCCRCHAELHEIEYSKQREETKKRYDDWVCKTESFHIWKTERSCFECKKQFIPKRKEQVYCNRNCQYHSMKKDVE